MQNSDKLNLASHSCRNMVVFGGQKLVLILVLSFIAANADHHAHHSYHHDHPIVKPNCGQICPKTLPKLLHFEVGQVYTLKMDGQTIINLKEGHTIDLKTKVDVHVLSPCEFSLKLRDSKVSGVPNPQELDVELDSSPPLRFGAHDGKIMGVCPAPEEETWTLNVKKSILSAIQSTTKDLSTTTTGIEVDFSGHCTTTYRPLSDINDPKNIVLEKTKNLNKCHLRGKNIAEFQSKSMDLLTAFLRENLPILQSSQRCRQEIRNGELFSVKCVEEQHVFTDGESIVKSTLNLNFTGKAPAPDAGLAGPVPLKAETLLMSRDDEDEKTSTEAEVLAILKGMCAQVSGKRLPPEVNPQFTETLNSLVRALRTLPENATRTLDREVKSREFCQSYTPPYLRKLFLAASSLAASDPSIQTLINAYKGKELSETQTTLLFSLVALKAQPTEMAIDRLVALIQPEDSQRSIMLSLSIIVRNFCETKENCMESPGVKRTVGALLQKLNDTHNDLVKITAIKALDNIRLKNEDQIKNSLLELAQNSGADSGVRVAALQTLQRVADDNIRQKLIQILSKDNETTEVRITAYKAVVLSGASAQNWETIKAISDPSIQNYILSHIRNLKKSSRKNLFPENAPDFDEPKGTGVGLSHNYVFPFKNASIEVDIVYTKNSIVPNLYTFGIRLPVIGKEYQLFEIQIRQQGLSQHFQKFFSALFSKGIGVKKVLEQLYLEVSARFHNTKPEDSVILQTSLRIAGENLLFIDTFEDIFGFVFDKLVELTNTKTIYVGRAISLIDRQTEVPSLLGFPMLIHLNDTIVMTGKKRSYETSDGHGNNEAYNIQKVNAYYTIMEQLSTGINVKVKKYRPGFKYQIRAEMTPSYDIEYQNVHNKRINVKINLPAGQKSLIKVIENFRLIDGNGVPKDSNEIEGSYDDNRCLKLLGINLCMTSTWRNSAPMPNVEFYVKNQDKLVRYIEFNLKTPDSNATSAHLLWSAQVNAGKRKYLGEFELRNPLEGIRKASVKLVSPIKNITVETSLLKTTEGNVSKIEFELKVPTLIHINSKYDVEVGFRKSNANVLLEYQLRSDPKQTLKLSRKSSSTYDGEKGTLSIHASLLGESSQYPQYNSKLTFATESKQGRNNLIRDSQLKFEWGPQLTHRLSLKHQLKNFIIRNQPLQMIGENVLSVEATPLKIKYDLKLKHAFSISNLVSIDFELEGTDIQGRSIKGAYKYELEKPIKQVTNASLSYPGREITLYEEVKKINSSTNALKRIYSFEKGKSVIVEAIQSRWQRTENFYEHFVFDIDIYFSHKPDRFKINCETGMDNHGIIFFKHNTSKDGQQIQKYDISYNIISHDAQVKYALKYENKSYQFSFIRVPEQSVSVKLVTTDEEKDRTTKLDAIIGRHIISNISLTTPEINAQLTANPLGEKKTLVFKFVSPKFDQNSNFEWVPSKYLKVDALSHLKTEPEKKVMVDAYLTKHDESTFSMTTSERGALDVDIKRVKSPNPGYIFNLTIMGDNYFQEYESNPMLTPNQNLLQALAKYFWEPIQTPLEEDTLIASVN